jgi:Domain of unknown function DUF11
MFRSTCYLGVIVVACVVAGLVASAGASRPGVVAGWTATKRCHYVAKKVHSKQKRVRVCRKAKAKPAADLVVTVTGPSTATFGDLLSYTVTVVNQGPGVALQVRLDSEVGWVPLTPPRFLPGHISASVSGGGRCGQPDVNIFNQAFVVCAVGSLAKGASVQLTVSFEIGRIAGRHLTVDAGVHTAARDPNFDNSEDTADTAMTGCHPSYPANDLCIAPPPPYITCADLDPYTDFHVDWAVADPDPHHLDSDHDGVACES